MSTTPSRPLENDEVDLKTLSSSIGNFFGSVGNVFFSLLQLIIRKIFWVIGIVVIGFAAGYFLDSFKTYEHQLIVRPNFNSIDYLTSKIDLLDARIKDRDTAFLKSIGIQQPRRLVGIKLKPVVDIYNFANRNELNFKTMELLAEDGDMNTLVVDNTTSKNYTYHMLTLVTVGETDSKKLIDPLMNYLNDSEYFRKVQEQSLYNVRSKIITNEKLIGQIDAILESIARGNSGGGTVVNGDSQLNDVIRTKDLLIEEQGMFRIELVSLDKIIKLSDSTLNIERTSGTEGRKKYLLPLILLLAVGIIAGLVKFYRNRSKAAS